MVNYYTFLGLDQTASKEEVKRSYRRLSKTYHPDFGGKTSDFLNLSEAYSTLSNDDLRAEYDIMLVRNDILNNFESAKQSHETRKMSVLTTVKTYFLRRRYYFSSLIPLTVITGLQISNIVSKFKIQNPLIFLLEIMVAVIISKVIINTIHNGSDYIKQNKYILVILTTYISFAGLIGTFSQFCGSIFYTCLGVYVFDYMIGKLILFKEFTKSLTRYWHYYVRNK